MDAIKQIIVGVSRRPAVVATGRAFLLYGIPVFLVLLTGWVQQITDPTYYGLALAAMPLIRAVAEGLLDDLKKRTQNAPRPNPPAGASPGQDGDTVRGID